MNLQLRQRHIRSVGAFAVAPTKCNQRAAWVSQQKHAVDGDVAAGQSHTGCTPKEKLVGRSVLVCGCCANGKRPMPPRSQLSYCLALPARLVSSMSPAKLLGTSACAGAECLSLSQDFRLRCICRQVSSQKIQVAASLTVVRKNMPRAARLLDRSAAMDQHAMEVHDRPLLCNQWHLWHAPGAIFLEERVDGIVVIDLVETPTLLKVCLDSESPLVRSRLSEDGSCNNSEVIQRSLLLSQYHTMRFSPPRLSHHWPGRRPPARSRPTCTLAGRTDLDVSAALTPARST